MTAENICVVCGHSYEKSEGRELTCGDQCHQILTYYLIEAFGEYKKVCSMVTGKCYRVPTRIIIERGLKHEDLVKFPEWTEK